MLSCIMRSAVQTGVVVVDACLAVSLDYQVTVALEPLMATRD